MSIVYKNVILDDEGLQEIENYHTYNGEKVISTRGVYRGKGKFQICDIEVEKKEDKCERITYHNVELSLKGYCKKINVGEKYRDGYITSYECTLGLDNVICTITVGDSRKPPLGVTPRYIFEEEVRELKEERMDDLIQAIQRYREARFIPKSEWLIELEQLRKELEK